MVRSLAWICGVVILVGWDLLSAHDATGQTVVLPLGIASEASATAPPPMTFGTNDAVAHTVSAWDFETFGASNPDSNVGNGRRTCTVGQCKLLGGVRLPAGALLTSIQLDGCDPSSTGRLRYTIFRSPAGTNSLVNLLGFGAAGDTGSISAQPGCGLFTATLPSPETIDNAANTYWFLVIFEGSDSAVEFTAMRAFYALQIRPAPVAATFGDVPTSHPFFQFVEALVASGITAGCGGGNYCPDAPLTRGQMAVFLSKALGLHFAP
jgi:hypothetical protein